MENIEKIRHSLAHIMASAVLELWPKTKLGMGPAIENGFYYDFQLPKPLEENDLIEIEKKMKELISQKLKFEKQNITKRRAKKLFAIQPYKLELIKELPGENVSIYTNGEFVDLCKGPHIKSTKEIIINSFKLTRIAGAYWKGSEKNKMLTRIYGLAFETEKELMDYLKMQEESEKRDHRKLGKDLKIFTFSDFVGPGLPLWLPNGAAIIEEIEKLGKDMETKAGYLRVKTPHIANEIKKTIFIPGKAVTLHSPKPA